MRNTFFEYLRALKIMHQTALTILWLEEHVLWLSIFYKRQLFRSTYIEAKCNGIISQYDFLISAFDDLKNIYDEILKHPNVTQGEELTLQHFYEAVYSSNISTQEELDKARNDLQQIASAYIQSSDTIDENIVSNIADCIEWLEKCNQCKELRDKINAFETDNLTKTYIIA